MKTSRSVADLIFLMTDRLFFLSTEGKGDWYIPLSICRADDSSDVLLRTVLPTRKESPSTTVTVAASKDGTPASKTGIRLNPGVTGFFRVQYDQALLPMVLEALANGKVPASDRLSLLSDHFSLVRRVFFHFDVIHLSYY